MKAAHWRSITLQAASSRSPSCRTPCGSSSSAPACAPPRARRARRSNCSIRRNVVLTSPETGRDSLRLEVHRHAVDAIALVGRRGAVVEDVAEVAAAAAAMHLGAQHAIAAIDLLLDRARNRIIEARPAGAALEFPGRHEQRLAAAHTGKRAGALFVVEGAAAGRLGAMRAHDPVLLGREQAPPLLVRVRDRILLGVHLPLLRKIQASSSTISGCRRPPDTATRATAIGRLNRRGPALPGLRNRTPSRVSISG